MNKFKVLIAVLILALSIAGAYFIISNYDSFIPENKNTSTETSGNNPVGIEPITNSNLNLTELLAQKMEERIGEQNTSGFQTLDGKTLISAPDPKVLVEELIAEAEKNFDPEALRGKVDESRIKTSEDISAESISKYFNSFSQIMINATKDMPEYMSEPEKLTISDYGKIRDAYASAVNNFYNLVAPESVLAFHKKEIELLTTKRNVFGVIANAEEDPMTAFLAVDMLLIIDQEFDKLKEDITSFLKTI